MALVTRGDLKRHISKEFGLDLTAGSDEELLMNDWANKAVEAVLLDTRITIRSSTTALVAGTGDYTVAAPLLVVEDLYLTGGTSPLVRKTLGEILDLRLNTPLANDNPRYYAWEGDSFYLYPAPASNGTLTLYGVNKPTEMDTDARDFTTSTYGGIPSYGAEAILAYMRWRATLHSPSGGRDPNAYRKYYDAECAILRKRSRGTGGRRSTPMRVGYPYRSGATSNAIYPSGR